MERRMVLNLIGSLACGLKAEHPYSIRVQYIPASKHGGPSRHLVLIRETFPAILRIVALDNGFYVFREYSDDEIPYFYSYECPDCIDGIQNELTTAMTETKLATRQ